MGIVGRGETLSLPLRQAVGGRGGGSLRQRL
jgi:hypothetical protein